MAFGFFSPLYKTFYSRKFYSEEALNGKGNRFTLLLLMAFISMTLLFVRGYAPVAEFFDKEAPRVIKQMPTITIKNKALDIDTRWPHTVSLLEAEEGGEKVSIMFMKKLPVGTEGLAAWMDKNRVFIMITPKNVVVYEDVMIEDTESKSSELSIFGFDDFEEGGTLTPDDITNFMGYVKVLFWPLVLFFGFLASWIFRIMTALALSVIGLILNGLVRTCLPYSAVLRLSALVLWPTFVIAEVLYYFGFDMGFAIVFLALAFLIYAFWAARKSMKQSVC